MLYKDFIAQAAIQIFQKLHQEPDGSNPEYIESCIVEDAEDAVHRAKVLAKALEDDWRVNSDKTTVFFDPADQVTTPVVNQLYDIENTLKESFNKVSELYESVRA